MGSVLLVKLVLKAFMWVIFQLLSEKVTCHWVGLLKLRLSGVQSVGEVVSALQLMDCPYQRMGKGQHIVYRIAREKWAQDLSGVGAEKYPGRWNLPDFRMLYTAGPESLATLEVRAHFDDEEAPTDQWVIVLELPNGLVQTLDPLPEGWDITPAGLASKYAGTEFLKEQQHLALKVPSAIIKSEYNYLINPHHPHIERLRIQRMYPKLWDERIIRK